MMWGEYLAAGAMGLAIGCAVGWWLRSLKADAPDLRVEEELRAQISSRDAELNRLRGSMGEAGSARAAAEASRAAADELARQRTQEGLEASDRERVSRDRLAACEAGLSTTRAELSRYAAQREERERDHEVQLRELRDQHAAALTLLQTASEQALHAVRDQFKATAAEALAVNNPKFLELANELFARFQATSAGDLGQRQENIAALVRPLEEQLRTYQVRLQQSESQQQAALGQVKQHLEVLAAQSVVLSGETQRLRGVLGSNQARGRWGEETLRRVVEAAGLSVHCDFDVQVQEGDKKPDLLVRLPGDRVILVDSKVPDLDFLEALGTADDVRRGEVLREHAASLRSTIKALAEREYPQQFTNALDYVVLFLPAESLFSAALEGDRNLIVWAAERHILLATPASLIALLRSVAVSWQQHDQSQNAHAIASASRELYERVVRFLDHFESIRDGLHRANEAYNRAVGSYESRVRPQGEKLVRLGAAPEQRPLTPMEPLDPSLRLPGHGTP